mgnify:CR=1 FL=1
MKPGKGRKVLVAMSGGVDSSVAAAILRDQGYQVVGCFMRLGSEDSVEEPSVCRLPIAPQQTRHQGCCSVNDAADARHVAALLDVPFYVLNFKRDFGRIIDYFVDEYNAGRTPNPCVRCNDWLKFGKLMAYADSIDADYVATGHYARIDRSAGPGRARLLRGLDRAKDQSYVLFGTRRERLERMLLPIGEMRKADTRRLAQELGLPVFDKPDSQEICFVPDNDYARLVAQRSDKVRPGKVLDREGNVLGEHPGQQHFTIGQRRGIGVAVGRPIYVIDKDPVANTVTVGSKEDLLTDRLDADQTNWLIDPPHDPMPCTIKVRYNSQPVPGTVRATGENSLTVTFDEPLAAVTPGQAVVCYREDELIGGGWINRAWRERGG